MVVKHTAAAIREAQTDRLRALAAGAGIFLFLLAFAIALQWAGGAYSAEFGGYPDEPAHYVTGLMIRDYLGSGSLRHPVEFAENFYFHYPKVAFGMWGPLLHVIEGVWMLLFSPVRASVLVLMALISTALAFTLSRVVGREFGWPAGIAAGMALLAVRCVQTYTAMVMADNLCALMEFWAILCFGRFLGSERRRDALLFALFAILAVLTKGNGVALALVPPIAIAITRRWRLFTSLNLWLAAATVAVVAGPWQYYSSGLLAGISSARHLSWSISFSYLVLFVQILGPWLLPFVLIGVYARIVRPFSAGAVDGRWAAVFSLIPAFWIFHSLTPSAVAELRYVAAVAAPVLLLFAAGIAEAANWLPKRVPHRAAAAGLAVAGAGVFLGTAFAIPRQAAYGFGEVAAALVQQPDSADSVVLISSEGGGEGMFVSEMAMRDRRPRWIVLRATKSLASLTWMGSNYQENFPTPQQTEEYLEQIPASVLVIDKTPGRNQQPHHRTLIAMLAMYPDRWRSLGAYPRKIQPAPAGGGIEVYELIGHQGRQRGKIRLDLRYTLGRSIER